MCPPPPWRPAARRGGGLRLSGCLSPPPCLSPQDLYNPDLHAARYFGGNNGLSELTGETRMKLEADLKAAGKVPKSIPKSPKEHDNWEWVDKVEKSVSCGC